MSNKSVLLFEDDAVRDLEPVVVTRPAFELRFGMWNLRERVERLDADLHVRVRDHLAACVQQSLPACRMERPVSGRVLLINARMLADVSELRDLWERDPGDAASRSSAGLHWAWVDAERVEAVLGGKDLLPEVDTADGPPLARGLWDHVHRNGRQICEDVRELRGHGERARILFATMFEEGSARSGWLERTSYGGIEGAIVHPGVHLVEADDILFGEGCEVRPSVVLDASRGPIVLGPGARVESQSVLLGPCVIGAGCVVNPGSRIREATSLGAFCKVGGEIEDAVLLDLSNKQHDGFLGHAYLGSWVNLGADTNGSDLKNDYGKVSVDFGDRVVDTGETFVGPLIGDHAKTSINTMLNTGAFVGVSANLFGGGFPPAHVPNFSWGGRERLVEYRLDKALETSRRVLARRDVRWTQAYEQLLRHVFEHTTRPA